MKSIVLIRPIVNHCSYTPVLFSYFIYLSCLWNELECDNTMCVCTCMRSKGSEGELCVRIGQRGEKHEWWRCTVRLHHITCAHGSCRETHSLLG